MGLRFALPRLLALGAFFIALHAAAAERPRICVVLSGGGARGAAHIGVLKVLEEYRVPIDCIAGTSMGALVGAAYATGTTVPEMEKIIETITTNRLFKERPPRQELSMRRKQEDYENLASPEFGFRGGHILLQKGIVSGVELETVLRQLSKIHGYQRFDELPIPLRVVATDLVTGKQAVFGDGEIASVMRASMSVPGAVAPIEIGDMLLVDGGITNNLPVDIAREMGADIVIAVNLGTPLLKRKELGSIVGVTSQMLFILTEQNVQASIASLKPKDVLIEPELGNYSFANFDEMEKTLPTGEAAARKVAGFLQRLSLPPDQYAALRRKQLKMPQPDLRIVDEIRFEGLHHVNPAFAAQYLSTKAGEPIAQDVLDRDLRRLYGSGDYEHLSYRLTQEQGKHVLVIDATEKSWGPDYLRLGLALNASSNGDAYFDVLASYRRTWMNSYGAEWRTDLSIGRTDSIASEFYQPLIPGRYLFVAPRVELTQYPVDLYEDNKRFASYNLHYARAGVDIGTQITRYGEIRLGMIAGTLGATITTGDRDVISTGDHIKQGAYTARVQFDQIDSVNFPHEGYHFLAEIFDSRPSLGATDAYTKWEGQGNAATTFGDNTFVVGVHAGGKLGNQPLPSYDIFQSGGFLNQSGYRTGALLSESVQFGRLMYYRKLADVPLMEGAYAGFSLEAGKYGNSPVPDTPTGWIRSGSVYFAVDTLLGPVYLAYGQSTGKISSVYFFLGRPF